MIHNKIGVLFLVGLVCILGAHGAGAVEVYLNGVRITGVKDQVIDKAKVVLDRDGNVYITAPEYKVREMDHARYEARPEALAPVGSSTLEKNYYVVTEVSRLGMTGYSVQVIVNNRLVKVLSDDISQHVLELNPYLTRGRNTVSFRSVQSGSGGHQVRIARASDSFILVLGEGEGRQGGALRIENVLAEFKVTAVDGREKSKTFTINAR